MSFEMIEFPYFSDAKGETVPFELDDSFPFEVKRIYVITGNTEVTRGGHAHLIEDEFFVCVNGNVTSVVNDGNGDTEIILDKKHKGLLVRKNCWHEFHKFSKDAVMLCFSSTHYLPGEENYIRDKQSFLELTNNRG